jgi:hypothetical protein
MAVYGYELIGDDTCASFVAVYGYELISCVAFGSAITIYGGGELAESIGIHYSSALNSMYLKKRSKIR